MIPHGSLPRERRRELMEQGRERGRAQLDQIRKSRDARRNEAKGET